ncbi:MAG: glycosyltransferase [Deltaproteobacteria bacterium]|nr:glycosyltransferase [Deltaproteobacteria bacterium]MBW2016519.1 glycosyltransferase [Deltaproteobacteria bacterium]MBW2128276.1 glycosyltransferase [Deltaproteobacteria bacterium]MBW2302271.1 glycosyltransferase [Deltaproteobacteria bacterium]
MFEKEVNPEGITKAELVVSIPSYNEADSISYPTIQASEGLVKYFPDLSTVIVNCDNNSPDNTKQAFLDTPTKVPKIYISTPPGVKGKGNNFKNLFEKVLDLEARAIVVVDADLKSITPEWIKHLAEPLFDDFSYVAPLYVRHKYDGTITNGIAYPLSRALYGRRVRQPIGGDFGFSGELARVYLESAIWDEAVANFGIDIWMTTLALNQGIQVCQSFMGKPKIHRPKDPAAALGPMFRQVVGTIFNLMVHFESYWTRVKYSKPTAIYGFGLGEVAMPPKVEVDTKKLFERFHEGFDEHKEILQEVLSRDVFQKLLEIKGMKERMFAFPTDLWARILYDMAVGYRDTLCDPDDMMEALIPLYFGRTLSFVKKTRRMSTQQAEEAIEEDCMVFEKTKPYLLKRWAEGRPAGENSG